MDFRSVPRVNHSYIVIDNFLDNPDKVRESILYSGIEQFVKIGNFPGVRTFPVDKNYQEMVLSKLNRMLPFEIKDANGSDCYAFGLSLESDIKTTGVHKDLSDWTGVLYLTPNAPIESGTILFNEDNSLTDTIGNVYNRLIFFRGGLIPHRSNMSFGDSLETGRLTQHFFFNEVK